jgi:crotonobetainyl-CoA:carnitine CoA-transferase CaiB-like acyl-CoA transferase
MNRQPLEGVTFLDLVQVYNAPITDVSVLGSHTETVLVELAGVTAAELPRLRNAKVVG